MSGSRIALDLTKTHAERRFGDITAFFTWFGPENKPCLALLPTNMIGKERAVPCAVLLEDAWIWDEDRGNGRLCAHNSAWFARTLGLATHPNSALRVTSIIRECIGDLLKIPPKPADLVVVADAVRIDPDGKEHHSEIWDDVG